MSSLEPNAIAFPERRSTATEEYKNMVVRSFGAWANMSNNRTDTRTGINRNKDRVLPTRLTNEEIVELYGDSAVKKLLKHEGLLGDEANEIRVLNDRPKVFSFKTESNFPAKEVKQFSNSINIF